MLLKKIKKEILDTVFPIFCVGCKKEGELLCRECAGLILPAEKQFCPLCRNISEFGKACGRCEEKSALSAVISCGYYHNPVLRESIGALKYDNAREIIPQIEKIIIRFTEKCGFLEKYFSNNSVLIPVPLHRKRLWQRGFNQAEIIAQILSRNFNLQINNSILKRKIATGEQAKMKPEERVKNIKNAFVLLKKEDFTGKSVILIDDVYTTGSTMQECAKIIRVGTGVDKVYGFVLARG
jgi:ComF family protein